MKVSVYQVKKPILGFENVNEIEIEKADGISAILKGIGENKFQLPLLHTYYDKDNDFKIPEDIRVLLEIQDNSNISVYLIVILNQDIEQSTINLCSPLIFNNDNKMMAQAMIPESSGALS